MYGTLTETPPWSGMVSLVITPFWPIMLGCISRHLRSLSRFQTKTAKATLKSVHFSIELDLRVLQEPVIPKSKQLSYQLIRGIALAWQIQTAVVRNTGCNISMSVLCCWLWAVVSGGGFHVSSSKICFYTQSHHTACAKNSSTKVYARTANLWICCRSLARYGQKNFWVNTA